MQQRDLSPLPSNSVAGLRLIFDPSLSPLYRVVCFVDAKNCILVYLYDSETHKWKLGGQSIGGKMSFRNGIYFNGGICFLRFLDSSHFIPDYGSLSNIPNLPWHHCLGRLKNYVMESNGVVLCLTLSRRKEGSNLLHVSEMKEIENVWSNKYRTDTNPILATCVGRDCTSMHLLGVIRGEKEQDSLLLLRVNGKIVSYKFYDDVFEVIVDYTNEEFQKENRERYVEDAHHFIHSLAPV